MDRRRFLKLLGFGAAAVVGVPAVLDPEKLLWTPGEKTIIDLGAHPGAYQGVDWTSEEGATVYLRRYNQYLDVDWIERETLKLMAKQLTLAKQLRKEYTSRRFKVGDRLVILTGPNNA